MERGMKRCELCQEEIARIHCGSDQAGLCWDCDSKVHSANFLVAKHSRTLLCHVCQSPTIWSGSGANLGQSMSTCESCAGRGIRVNFTGDGVQQQESQELVDENSSEDELEEEEEDDEDEIYSDCESGDNQIVPWSPPPPPAASSSSSDVGFSRGHNNGDGADSFELRQRNNDSDLDSNK